MYIRTFDELFNTFFYLASHDKRNSSFYFTEGVIAIYCLAHCKLIHLFFYFKQNYFL